VAVAILLAQLLLAIVGHRDRSELGEQLKGENHAKGVYSLFLLTNRDRPVREGMNQTEDLIASSNPLLREWVFTTNFSRILRPSDQSHYLERLGTSGSDKRARFYFDHGIHKTPWLTLAELDEYLAELDE
jgi:hypothetical protein